MHSIKGILANRVDPDQTPQNAASNQEYTACINNRSETILTLKCQERNYNDYSLHLKSYETTQQAHETTSTTMSIHWISIESTLFCRCVRCWIYVDSTLFQRCVRRCIYVVLILYTNVETTIQCWFNVKTLNRCCVYILRPFGIYYKHSKYAMLLVKNALERVQLQNARFVFCNYPRYSDTVTSDRLKLDRSISID